MPVYAIKIGAKVRSATISSYSVNISVVSLAELKRVYIHVFLFTLTRAELSSNSQSCVSLKRTGVLTTCTPARE